MSYLTVTVGCDIVLVLSPTLLSEKTNAWISVGLEWYLIAGLEQYQQLERRWKRHSE